MKFNTLIRRLLVQQKDSTDVRSTAVYEICRANCEKHSLHTSVGSPG